MSTVSKEFADNIARHDGYYNGDRDNTMGDNPRALSIVEYEDAWGGVAYGVNFAGQINAHPFGRYSASQFVHSPRVYWQAGEPAIETEEAA